MFIAPTFEGLDVNNRPWATLLLIAVCCWIFFIIQDGDTKRLNAIIWESGANGLIEIEARYFVPFQETKPANKRILLPSKSKYDSRSAYYSSVWWKMHRDAAFQRGLMAGTIITEKQLSYMKWLELHEEQKEALKTVIDYTYSFVPAWPSWTTAFTSTFLHGSFQHLLGNMVFLFLGGALLEAIIGGIPLLVVFVASGVLASWFASPFYGDSTIMCLGASGGISGILSTYAILLGIKRVPVFISLGFIFTTLRLPALLLLFIWSAKEILFASIFKGDTVNYMAHLGGYIVGGTLGIPLRISCKNKIKQLLGSEKKERKESIKEHVAKGRQHLQKLQYEKARQCMEKALVSSQDDTTILTYLCAIYKRLNNVVAYQQTAEHLIFIQLGQENKQQAVVTIFREYTDRNYWILSADILHRLVGYFGKNNYEKEVLIITRHLCHNSTTDEGTPGILLLAARLLLKNQKEEAIECINKLQALFPDRQETRIASELINSRE